MESSNRAPQLVNHAPRSLKLAGLDRSQNLGQRRRCLLDVLRVHVLNPFASCLGSTYGLAASPPTHGTDRQAGRGTHEVGALRPSTSRLQASGGVTGSADVL